MARKKPAAKKDGKAKGPSEASIFDQVVEAVISDLRTEDPGDVAAELGLPWSEKNKTKWHDTYAQCEGCDNWHDISDLMDEHGDVAKCPVCQDVDGDWDRDDDW